MSKLLVAVACATLAAVSAAPSASATSPGRNGRIFFRQMTGPSESLLSILPTGHGRRTIARGTNVVGVSVSPRGTRIAYLAVSNGAIQLMTAHPDGSGATRVPLPFTDLYPDRPAWSLDGRTLLFTRDSSDGIEGGHPMEIYRVNRDGSGLRVLAQGAHSPSWSPRGHGRIAYAESGHCFSVFTMTSTGRHKRRVLDANPRRHTHCHQFFTQIDWSPSGRQTAFTGPGGGVMVSDLRGNMRRLSRTGVSPVWSPDGRQIAWTESRSRNYRVVSIALVIATTAGRVQRRIPGAAIDSWQPLR